MTPRLASFEGFRRWQDQLKASLGSTRKMITVCGGTGCGAFGSGEVLRAFEAEVKRRRLGGKVEVKCTGCHGFCEKGPVVVILPEKIFYPNVQVKDVPVIVEKTVLQGKVIERLLYADPSTGQKIAHDHRVPFYEKQQRQVFRLNGLLNPVDLEDYLARDGYSAAVKALSTMTPEQVIDEVREAGLRGRGGAGFSTGTKWGFCRKSPGTLKYLICNADEGDPGAFMDRSLLEGTPHAILEGMIIAAYAIGASHGIIYVRAEYPLAVRHSEIAVQQARGAGLLGKNILGGGFDFDVEIHQGCGAFVCGEETALIASIEGQRGMPRPRPPFPAVSGLFGRPTNINNVETLANLPLIILKGREWYRSIGTEGSKGTKIFALAGKVNNTGLVEVPMGSTLRQIVFDIGGGIPRGRRFKAAQMGGPSGGCVPAKYLDLPIDYDSVKQIGAIMGSGGLVVMDEATCMVDIARFFTDFVRKESCGKCPPCRVGTRQMYEILSRIVSGKGQMEDLERLQQLGEMIRKSSLCGLGQTAPNPVLSTIRYFRDEYEAHIREKRCPAHVCEALSPVTCVSACPAHVNVPEYVALIASGRDREALDLIRRRNPFPSVCGRACDHPCQTYCRRGDIDQPVAIRHLKRFVSDRVKAVGNPAGWQGRRSGQVAVIGAGPAGLTAAYFLALKGREVTVYEKSRAAGGMLMLGIPKYRLPRKAIERDIEYIRRTGVKIRTGREVKSLAELRQPGCDAIFVAVGAQQSNRLKISGEDKAGVTDALLFLQQANGGKLKQLKGRTVVIGGGNAAIDSARTALRLGAESVTLLYRRSREEMPAIREEIEDALHEGIRMRFQVAPVCIEGDSRVQAVRCVEMELGQADEDGRRQPVPKPGSEVRIEADHVIVAIGQGPSLGFAAADGCVVVSQGRLKVDPVTQRTGTEAIFGGGDAVTGPATIIEAIAAGQRAAQAIDILLGGDGELPVTKGLAPSRKPDESEADRAHQPIRMLSPEKRKRGFLEVTQGYPVAAARTEAHRCLRCDLEEKES